MRCRGSSFDRLSPKSEAGRVDHLPVAGEGVIDATLIVAVEAIATDTHFASPADHEAYGVYRLLSFPV